MIERRLTLESFARQISVCYAVEFSLKYGQNELRFPNNNPVFQDLVQIVNQIERENPGEIIRDLNGWTLIYK
ncbi:MAG: hypothetical protein ABIH59_02975 [archaeon]